MLLPDWMRNFDKDVVGPIYRLAFLISAIIAIIGTIYLYLTGYLPAVFASISGQVFRIWLLADTVYFWHFTASFCIILAVWIIVTYFASSERRRRRNIVETISFCTMEHVKFTIEARKIMTSGRHARVKRDQLLPLAARHVTTILTQLTEIFRLMTGHPCHASLKTFDGERVFTRGRDILPSNLGRRVIDENADGYPYEANTAFADILNDPKCHMYVSNHLKFQAFFKRYVNANPLWRKQYSACAVLPVTLNGNPAMIAPQTVTGFVCVDNRKGGFRPKEVLPVLSIFAALFFDVNQMIFEVEP